MSITIIAMVNNTIGPHHDPSSRHLTEVVMIFLVLCELSLRRNSRDLRVRCTDELLEAKT